MGHVDMFLFLLTILIIGFNGLCSTSAQSYRYHICSGGNYTEKSTFGANLNLLLPSLSSSSNNKVTRNGYYNDTVGRNSDAVYGSFQCRGDVTSQVCKDCVSKAVEDIKRSDRCPNSKQAIILYDECMLRYSDQYYFSIMQENPAIYLWNPNENVTNPDQFNRVLGDLLDGLVKEAVSSTSSNYFATKETNVTPFNNVYGLVQCTLDISQSDCNRCLRGAIAQLLRCCDRKQGGRVIFPSCNFRYESEPFYQSKVTPAPPPSLGAPPPGSTTNTTTTDASGKNTSKLVVYIVVPSVVGLLAIIGFWCFCLKRKKTKKKHEDADEIRSAESLQFNFSIIRAATDDFSEAYKLGEGGFGSVYKGKLLNGQEIAVKRLSANSGQGEEEFKNEVTLLAKLQHRNLVRLLGFCFDGVEKILIYEFLRNASLDQFIFGLAPLFHIYFLSSLILDHMLTTITCKFEYIYKQLTWYAGWYLDAIVDPIKHTYLDWERRYKIIGGIARGLLYLHEDSRLTIIHRDLKAANILLDLDMNPKISDFGMARLFVADQSRANTNRIVGTYGYMSPEYAMHGQFSLKSDVFSFGVLVLEILTGQRNSSFYESEVAQDLLSYAWRHWKNGTALEILDPFLRDNCSTNEVMRCMHIGLLCVQEHISDRPTMGSVVLMLNSYSLSLALPAEPAFFVNTRREASIISSNESEEQAINKPAAWSVNEVSISILHPR